MGEDRMKTHKISNTIKSTMRLRNQKSDNTENHKTHPSADRFDPCYHVVFDVGDYTRHNLSAYILSSFNSVVH